MRKFHFGDEHEPLFLFSFFFNSAQWKAFKNTAEYVTKPRDKIGFLNMKLTQEYLVCMFCYFTFINAKY